jgi:hypothetical protein
MNRKDELPKTLTIIKNHSFKKKAFGDHLKTSEINVARNTVFPSFKFV